MLYFRDRISNHPKAKSRGNSYWVGANRQSYSKEQFVITSSSFKHTCTRKHTRTHAHTHIFIAMLYYMLQNILLVLKTVANKTVPFHSLILLLPITF
jgi:hypothetical protein